MDEPIRPRAPWAMMALAAAVCLFAASATAPRGRAEHPAVSRTPDLHSGLPIPAFNAARAALLTRTGAILAGMKDAAHRAGASPPSSSAWLDYCRFLDRTWSALEAGQFQRVRRWAGRELAAAPRSPVVYYPFSGPDFLYASLLFPQAEVFILTGLEPVGDFPVDPAALDDDLDKMIAVATPQLRDILGLTFFRTNDLEAAEAGGPTAGLLFAFLVRTGHEILDANHVYIGREGKLHVIPPERARGIDPALVRGLSVLFRRAGESVSRRLFYFSMDLSNAGLKKHPEYVKFVGEWPRPTTLLKATSFLLHYQTFSSVRRLILERSQAVLQDDSGIPLRLLEPGRWALTYFGRYVGPIDMFAEFYQEDLKNAFLGPAVRPLGFAFGYRFKPKESVLMLAVARPRPGSPPPALVRVTADGVDADDIVVPDTKPEIRLEFSGPAPPEQVSASLAGSSDVIPLDLAWEDGGRRAVGRPGRPLRGHETYAVAIDGLRPGREPEAPGYKEEWRFRVLEQPAPAFGDRAIVIDRRTQQVFLCGARGAILKTYPCSTGLYYPTRGVFRVSEKISGARSLFDESRFSFFTVFQMSETGYKVGLHSSPVYPDGRSAGALGLPNSHGCVRLAYDDAKFLYEWVSIGTRVIVD